MQEKMQELLTILKAKNLTLASCESFTGGMFSDLVTNIPHASAVFLGGFVTYSPKMKKQVGVKKRIIKKYGIVSQQVAEAMVEATIKRTQAHLVVSFTGNAGPSAQEDGQVGVGYFSFSYLGSMNSFKLEKPKLSRLAFKKYAVDQALTEILHRIQK